MRRTHPPRALVSLRQRVRPLCEIRHRIILARREITANTAMAIETIAENSANRENYEQNESDLDRAIEAIAELKTKDPAAAKKINNLEAQFEQAIRLRRMRIETLESHVSP